MSEIQIYDTGEVELEVRYQSETLWLTLGQIADLFGVQKPGVSKHLRNIFSSGELSLEATVSKMETVQSEGGRGITASRDLIAQTGRRPSSQSTPQCFQVSPFAGRDPDRTKTAHRPRSKNGQGSDGVTELPDFLFIFFNELRLKARSDLGLCLDIFTISRNNTRHASPRKRTRAGFFMPVVRA
ncbi:hypothetical protein [Polycyclovorans algicola]|uniref:hypothetical protein n=1 Tax=Polycyclovorans algicola TaxID=616992 RepID=UPI00190F1476|nr:hypothetical protein [Polycyclovorans algicola]